MTENKPYVALYPQNLQLGNSIRFNQQVIFTGMGKVAVGDNVEFGFQYSPHFFGFHELIVAETPHSTIEIGNRTTLSNDISMRALKQIKIGEDCLIGDRVTIYDSDFHEINPFTRRRTPGKIEPVVIGDNVWIGSQVIILKGVSIGNNTIIAAGSVVTRSFPANCVIAGNPAKQLNDNILKVYLADAAFAQNIRTSILSLVDQDNLLKAKELIKCYEDVYPNDLEIYSAKSVILFKEEKYSEAILILEEGLKVDSHNFDLLFNLAVLYELQGEFNEALRLSQEALKYCSDPEMQNRLVEFIELHSTK